MRITRPQMFMEIAHTVAKRSTCMRLNVGAVLVQGRSIVSVGYNGAPSGAPHCTGNDCPGKSFCQETIHAEVNALSHLPEGIQTYHGIMGSEFYDTRLDLYVTDSPCSHCYDAIAKDGRVRRIFFGTPYRITDHLENSLWDIEIFRVNPAGYVIDWDTKELVDVET